MSLHKNTHAVVTGASSGIGRAIAIELARAGASRVLVHYRSHRDGAMETVRRIEQLGGTAVTFAADLADADARARLAEFAFDELKQIQTWVHNAGADVLTGQAGEMDFDGKLRRLIDVDMIGTIGLARLVADHWVHMDTGPPRSMAFLGWDQSTEGMEGDAGQMFGPIKAAVTAFALSLAQTLAPHVRVNTISPGWIQTSWGESTSEYWNDRAKGQSLMQRWGRPEDVAAAVVFATDPANSFLTGQTIAVNGGWSRRFDR